MQDAAFSAACEEIMQAAQNVAAIMQAAAFSFIFFSFPSFLLVFPGLRKFFNKNLFF